MSLLSFTFENFSHTQLEVLTEVTVKMEREGFTETSVHFYQTTCRHIPEFVCVCVYVIHIIADLRYFCVQCKNKFGVLQLRSLQKALQKLHTQGSRNVQCFPHLP